jgi:hypothetical protein
MSAGKICQRAWIPYADSMEFVGIFRSLNLLFLFGRMGDMSDASSSRVAGV